MMVEFPLNLKEFREEVTEVNAASRPEQRNQLATEIVFTEKIFSSCIKGINTLKLMVIRKKEKKIIRK